MTNLLCWDIPKDANECTFNESEIWYSGSDFKKISTSQHIPFGLFSFRQEMELISGCERTRIIFGMDVDDKNINIVSTTGNLQGDIYYDSMTVYDKLKVFEDGDCIALELQRIQTCKEMIQYVIVLVNNERVASRIISGKYIKPHVSFESTTENKTDAKVKATLGLSRFDQGIDVSLCVW